MSISVTNFVAKPDAHTYFKIALEQYNLVRHDT